MKDCFLKFSAFSGNGLSQVIDRLAAISLKQTLKIDGTPIWVAN